MEHWPGAGDWAQNPVSISSAVQSQDFGSQEGDKDPDNVEPHVHFTWGLREPRLSQLLPHFGLCQVVQLVQVWEPSEGRWEEQGQQGRAVPLRPP